MRSSAGRWLAEARTVLERIEQSQMGAISAAAERCAEAISSGGLVHLFGTGHSRIPLEEMFPRYGSYPGFHPIAELSMTFHTQVVGSNGQRQAMFIERTEGLAEQILANFNFGPADVMIVFSVGRTERGPHRDGYGGKGTGDDRRCGHIARRVDRRRASSPHRDQAGGPCRHRDRPVHPGGRRHGDDRRAWPHRSGQAPRSPTPRWSTR